MAIREDLAKITIQENSLQFRTFMEDDAWGLGIRMREACARRKLPVAVQIRRSGYPLFLAALSGSTPDNLEWARRKANVVERFHRSSYAVGLELAEKSSSLLERFGLPLTEFAAHGGSFPIRVAGLGFIGSVTVSGLPQREDHELLVEVLCGVLDQSHAELKLD